MTMSERELREALQNLVQAVESYQLNVDDLPSSPRLNREMHAAKALLARPEREPIRKIDIVFDGPIGKREPLIGRFVCVTEADKMEPIEIGEIVGQQFGYWALRIPLQYEPSPRITREEAEKLIDEYFKARFDYPDLQTERKSNATAALLDAMGVGES